MPYQCHTVDGHSNPDPAHRCTTCQYWGGYTGTAGICRHRGTTTVMPFPEQACAFWRREPGGDDHLPIGYRD